MPKPRKRKPPKRESPKVWDGDGASDWTEEFGASETVRLRPDSPTLWRESLKRLRKDFLFAQKQHGPLRCALFHHSTSKVDAQMPPFDMYKGAGAARGTIYHDFRQFIGPDGKAIYLKHPVVDAEGKRIVDSQGRGIMCAMPALRNMVYYGTMWASVIFRELAERAGRALLGSRHETIAWIPRDTLFTYNDENRWVWSVFDLAWQGRHPSLRAERKTWLQPTPAARNTRANVAYLPYDLQQLRSIHKFGFLSGLNIPEEWTKCLPDYFISELPDLLQGSADLVDTLLDMAGRTETEGQQAQRSSETPPASKEIAQKVAQAASHKSGAKRSRKPDTNPKEDRRIANAWLTGQYKTYADLDEARKLKPGTARKAVDRHGKRK